MSSATSSRAKRRWLGIALGITASVLIAGVIAAVVHQLLPPGASTYALDADRLALAPADVGSQFTLVVDANAKPTQMTLRPLPYQQQLFEGRLHYFLVNSALSPQGRAEIASWEQPRGFTPTDPPAIFGPFVTEHTGIFEVTSVELSYRTADAAHKDYTCCTFNFANNYAGYHTIPVQLGEEANAWGGIRDSPTNPPREYEEQVFYIHWRHGPIVSTCWIDGAHDITFDQAVELAHIVDQRIAAALQGTSKGAFHASDTSLVAILGTASSAICSADRRLDDRLRCL